jgi:DNA-binding CsgD family transcriptional regulator
MNVTLTDLVFHQRLGRLIDKLGEDDFWGALVRLLAEAARFDAWSVILFYRSQPPRILADSSAQDDSSLEFAEYRGSLYQIDPFYVFSRELSAPGIYRLDEVAPDAFRETEYFRQFFSRLLIEDEVQFLLPLNGQGVLSLSLGNRRRFLDQEIGSFHLFTPWLLPLMQKHLRLDARPRPQSTAAVPDRKIQLETSLRLLDKPALTAREAEVALMILGGHSTKALARELGISPETARVHRRNLYAKLEISNQAGLFLLLNENELKAPQRMTET